MGAYHIQFYQCHLAIYPKHYFIVIYSNTLHFFFIAFKFSFVWMYHCLFPGGVFLSLATMNSTIMNSIKLFSLIASSSWDWFLEMGSLGQRINAYIICAGISKCHLEFPPAMYEATFFQFPHRVCFTLLELFKVI